MLLLISNIIKQLRAIINISLTFAISASIMLDMLKIPALPSSGIFLYIGLVQFFLGTSPLNFFSWDKFNMAMVTNSKPIL